MKTCQGWRLQKEKCGSFSANLEGETRATEPFSSLFRSSSREAFRSLQRPMRAAERNVEATARIPDERPGLRPILRSHGIYNVHAAIPLKNNDIVHEKVLFFSVKRRRHDRISRLPHGIV